MMKRLFAILAATALLTGASAQRHATDSLLPPPQLPAGYGWELHRGLNVEVDLSVFTQFGKHTAHGSGFTQRLSATYVAPLTDRLWLAAGGAVGNTLFRGDSYRSGALYAMLGYRFDEHWEAWLYAQKNVAGNEGGSYHGRLYSYEPLFRGSGLYNPLSTDRIGAAVKYSFNPSFSVQVSVEGVRYKSSAPTYFDQYNYPLPR